MTGTWFIESKQFADWKTNPDSFLWIHGIPGCGKTILSSTITEDVIRHYNLNPALAVVYFYFDFNDIERQFHEKMIRSIITQLSIQSESIPRALESLFSSKMDGRQQPMAGELLTTLRQMVRGFDESLIILVALDECRDRQQLLASIEEIVGWKREGLHILATSRKE
jgi:NACHT domain